MLANTLVVLGLGQNLVVFAISEYEHRALDTAHELLDYHATRSITEHTAQHLLQLFLGLVECRQNQHTLTSAQTISLKNVRGL